MRSRRWPQPGRLKTTRADLPPSNPADPLLVFMGGQKPMIDRNCANRLFLAAWRGEHVEKIHLAMALAVIGMDEQTFLRWKRTAEAQEVPFPRGIVLTPMSAGKKGA